MRLDTQTAKGRATRPLLAIHMFAPSKAIPSGPPPTSNELSSLHEGVEFVLNCGDWIAWLDTNKWQQRVLNITPMSAVRPAHKLFRGFDHILLTSATIGSIPLFLRALGIESEVGTYQAPCEFPPENRPIFYRARGSLSKAAGAPGFDSIVEAIRKVLREHEGDRGIVHCHSNELRDRLHATLSGEFGTRILTHGPKQDREGGVQRLRMSRNGVLLSIAMCEGLDLPNDDARFCIIAKIPWPDMGDPYVRERMRRDSDWYANKAALAVVQSSGRVVRHAADHGETYIFDRSFERLLQDANFPDWWLEAWK